MEGPHQDADKPKDARFYLSQVTLPEAWEQFKHAFAHTGCLVVFFIACWAITEFASSFIPWEISHTVSSIPNWIWYVALGIALWAMMGGDKITVPKFSVRSLIFISAYVGGIIFVMKYLPKWIGIPIFILLFLFVAFYEKLVEYGRTKYEIENDL